MASNHVNANILRELLDYNQATGCFTWKVRAGSAKAGSIAGTAHSEGYLTFNVKGIKLFAHRAAWIYMHGDIPEGMQIDHINGNRKDNRADNLRLLSHADNNRNTRSAKTTSKSGLLGVNWHKIMKKWRVQVRLNGATKHIGYYDDPIAAHRAYVDAKRKLHASCTI